ncbi:hypothetical protein C241_27180 [Bradyrhizobium lupini HPC(L)]|uniref:Uncharacterized protein n=1 Tax=Bradyrhizobium lupini HPC(L) TaxID=1229491 RepID=A0ABP2RLW0_RHILU|nr:hypothetical protein C241_27180 [Bradyrhizobium lupini HPC(L)]
MKTPALLGPSRWRVRTTAFKTVSEPHERPIWRRDAAASRPGIAVASTLGPRVEAGIAVVQKAGFGDKS